jgi:hypothetical protein
VPNDEFTFEAPATVEGVSVARTFIASMAIACAVDPDTAADLGLAVAELASVIVAHHPPEPLAIRGHRNHDFLVLALTPWPTDALDVDDADRWDLVTALFSSATVADGVAHLSTEPILEP